MTDERAAARTRAGISNSFMSQPNKGNDLLSETEKRRKLMKLLADWEDGSESLQDCATNILRLFQSWQR